jgi:Bacterial membrane protein YfhO
MTIRALRLTDLCPWILLALALIALATWVNRTVESAIAEAERGEGSSSRLSAQVQDLRSEMAGRTVYQFISGRPLPIPMSFVRRAWAETWRPRLIAVLGLGGALICLTWNLLPRLGPRGGAGGDHLARRVTIVLGVGAVGAFALFALPMITRSVYIHGDLANQNLPIRKLFADSLARGDDPTWSPMLYCGFDQLGEGQTGLYHPWHQFLYRLMPLDLAFNLELVSAYLFIFVGMVCLLRRWGLSWASCLFGAFTFAFGLIFRRYSHINVVSVASHIPWLLLCIDVLARDTGRRTVAWARVGLSLLTASQLLLGHPQFVWYSVLIEGLYLAACIGRTRSLGVAADYAVSKLIGVMLGGLQLLPTAETLRESTRSGFDHAGLLDKTAYGSLHPLNFLPLVCPYAFASPRAVPLVIPETVFSPYAWPPLSEGNTVFWPEMSEFALYAGLTPVILILGLLGRRSQNEHSGPRHVNLAAFCGLLVVVGALLAMGRFSPLFQALSWVPVVNVFRCVARYSLLMALGLSIASACGLERLCRAREGPTRWTDWSILAPGAVVLSANALAVVVHWVARRDLNGVLNGLVSSGPVVLLNPILAASTLGLFILGRRGIRSAVVLLALAHVVDLSFYNFWDLFRDKEIWTPRLTDLVAPAEVPPAWLHSRVFTDNPPRKGELPGRSFQNGGRNYPVFRGVRVANGYVGLPARSRLDYKRPEVQRVAGVGWVIPSWVIADAIALQGGPLPEFRLVSRVRGSDDPGDDLAAIDVETTALVPQGEAVSIEPAAPGSVQIEFQSNGEQRVRTRADSSQLLVVATRYHPGWKAQIDGVPAKVIQVNGDFMGCRVPAGEHAVRLTWEPLSHRLGWWLSGLGLALLALSPLLPAGVLPWLGRAHGWRRTQLAIRRVAVNA